MCISICCRIGNDIALVCMSYFMVVEGKREMEMIGFFE